MGGINFEIFKLSPKKISDNENETLKRLGIFTQNYGFHSREWKAKLDKGKCEVT